MRDASSARPAGLPLIFPSQPWAAKLARRSAVRGAAGLHRIFARSSCSSIRAATSSPCSFAKVFDGRPLAGGLLRPRLSVPATAGPSSDGRQLTSSGSSAAGRARSWTAGRTGRSSTTSQSSGGCRHRLSGLVLWFPETATRLLPGWSINLALIIHCDEALLAAGFIFTFHFFNGHFRPDKFPMDPVIFSGRITEEEMKDERRSIRALRPRRPAGAGRGAGADERGAVVRVGRRRHGAGARHSRDRVDRSQLLLDT